MKLFFCLLFFEWGCMLASAIFSTRTIGNKSIPKYMNNFYWYSLIAGVLSISDFFQLYFNLLSRSAYGMIDDILLVFHYIFLSVFIYKVLQDRKTLNYVIFLFFLILITILYCLFNADLSKPVSSAYSFSNFGLVLFCCIYYLQLFKKLPAGNFVKEPSFWVINGIFFCMCATIPIISLRGYLYTKIPYEQHASLESLVALAYGIMHLFFIKSYLCATNQRKIIKNKIIIRN